MFDILDQYSNTKVSMCSARWYRKYLDVIPINETSEQLNAKILIFTYIFKQGYLSNQ